MIHRSLQKYGFDEHVFEVVEETTIDKLDEREQYYIKHFNSYYADNPKGMNMTFGGSGQRWDGYKDTERKRAFLDRILKNGNAFKGKQHTQEVKDYISKFMSERNKALGITIPKWGAEKGRLKVIKPVLVYCALTGGFLTEHDSVAGACRHYNVLSGALADTLSKNRVYAGKYFCRYKESEDFPKNVTPPPIRFKSEKQPVLVFYKGESQRFIDPQQASENTGIPITTIRRAARYNKGKAIRTGHIFYYEDDYNAMFG